MRKYPRPDVPEPYDEYYECDTRDMTRILDDSVMDPDLIERPFGRIGRDSAPENPFGRIENDPYYRKPDFIPGTGVDAIEGPLFSEPDEKTSLPRHEQ